MTQENPGADMIEKDIVQTQNNISDTVNELQEKLQPQQLLRQVVGNPQEVPGQLFDSVKRNPIAAALVGVGVLWLISGKEAKMPSFKRSGGKIDVYDDQMASITRYEGESDEVYQGRLDTARSSYTGSSGTPSGIRGKLQGLRDKAKGLGGTSGNRLSGLSSAVKTRSQSARQWGVTKHDESPFGTAIAVAAAGAIAGLALPKTQIEREKLSPLRDTAVGKVTQLKDQALEAARSKLGDSQGNGGAARTHELVG